MTGPHPAVATVRSAVRRSLTHLGADAGSLVLVAVSGGPDSLALAAATAFVAPRLGLRAGAVVVDHRLQQGSGALAEQVGRTCRELGLAPVLVVAVDVQDDGSGPEAAARAQRYAAIERVLDGAGAVAALLGHTRDDQAETVLLGLARGSGTRSLAGMAARRGRLLRPLLDVGRDITAAACAASGLQAWADPHNADERYTRVRVRSLLPALEQALGPGAVRALARTAELTRQDADALDALAERAHDGVALLPGGTDLDVPALLALDPAVRTRVLRRAAVAAGSPPGVLGHAHVRAVEALLTGWHGQGPVSLPGGVSARRHCGRLTFVDADDLGADLQKVLLSQDQIAVRLRELAAQIDADYAGRDLLLVGVLKGAVMVMADLARALHSPAEMDWMAVSSYGSGTKSSGVVRILKDLDKDISGRDVLIVEDIVDSGLTLSWLVANLGSRGPASVEVCTLLRKPESLKVDVAVKYVGFDIDPEFVIGYGLDYDEKYRNLPFVGTLAPHVYS